MKTKLSLPLALMASILFSTCLNVSAQFLPHRLTDEELKAERELMPLYLQTYSARGFTTPPVSPVRTAAEWEEMQAIVISWKSYQDELTEIVRNAREECDVYIVCSDSNYVKDYLTSNSVDLADVYYMEVPSNSVWIRDYGPNSVYTNDIDSLLIVDWIYNRPSRPDDDVVPSYVAAELGVPLYETTQPPYELVHSGGNFMSDGFGTAFSSNLIMEDNPGLTGAEIDTIMYKFMGIERYIKMTVLPNDGIHHIDMHMKLLDEETLLVGEYPTGIADGPQIETNLDYILNNFNSVFGTEYRVIRIPMPPSPSGLYPPTGYYRTYTNSLIINKTILVPTYYEEYDTTALRIYREAMPGYKIVGINCNDVIPAMGAIHCIIHEIGTQDPLLISHQRLQDTYNSTAPYVVNSTILHRSGIQNATVYYRTDTLDPYSTSNMSFTDVVNNIWSGDIPAQSPETEVYYYIEAQANSGKTQVRPLPAPDAYWLFKVLNATAYNELNNLNFRMKVLNSMNIFNDYIKIEIFSANSLNIDLKLYDILGNEIYSIYQGKIQSGESQFSINTSLISGGMYFVVVNSQYDSFTGKIFVY